MNIKKKNGVSKMLRTSGTPKISYHKNKVHKIAKSDLCAFCLQNKDVKLSRLWVRVVKTLPPKFQQEARLKTLHIDFYFEIFNKFKLPHDCIPAKFKVVGASSTLQSLLDKHILIIKM